MDSFYSLMLLDGWPRLMIDALWISTLVGSLGVFAAFCCLRQPAAKAWVLFAAMIACAILPVTSSLVRTSDWGVPIRISQIELDLDSSDSRPVTDVSDIVERSPLTMPASKPVAQDTDLHQPASKDLSAGLGPFVETNPSNSSAYGQQTVLSVVGLLWLGLSTILLLRLLASFVSVQWIARSAWPCSDDRVHDAIASTSSRLGLRSPPQVLISDKISTPMVLAFFRSTLLIPNNERIHASENHLNTALAHELAHVKRYDGWKRLFVHLVVVLLPLQPIVWLMRRSFFVATEEACDDIAVSVGNDPVDLATVLTNWCGSSRDERKLLLTAGMSATRSRVLRLLNKSYAPLPSLSKNWKSGASVVALLLCSGISLPYFSSETEQTSRSQESATAVEDTESISGICVDENDKPIPNAEVRLFRVFVSDLETREIEQDRTKSNAKGEFRFNIESPVESSGWWVVAKSKGKATLTQSAHSTVEDSPFTMQMKPGGKLRGRVLDSGGNPVEGATVSFHSPFNNPVEGIRTSISDKNGNYELTGLSLMNLANQQPQPQPDGTSISISRCTGIVRHADYAWDRFSVTRVPDLVNITLQPSATVEGQITLKDSEEPAELAQIEFWNSQIPSDQWTRAVADENGHYEIKHLPPGKYRVGVRFHGRPNWFLPDVELVAGDNKKDISLERGGILKGQVVNVLSDEPFRLGVGERMQISEHNAKGISYLGMQSAYIEPDGSFEMLMPAGRRYVAMYLGGKWRGVNLHKFSAGQGVEIVEGETTEIELRIRPIKDPAKPVVGPQMNVPTKAAVAAIKQLGGWVELETIDGQQHVVEVNMVYHEDEEFGREDNDLIHDECLSYAHKFPYLKRLFLKEQQATDKGLANIRGLENLEVMYIWDASAVSDAGMAHLKNLTGLKEIYVGNSKITDESLRIFSKLPKLESLTAQGNQFTDKGLEHIQNMTQLKSLWLGQGENEITDNGVKHLAKLTQLETLDLQQSEITDSGLEHLHSLQQLKRFYHSGSGVTAKGYSSLTEVLPKLSK